MSSLFNTGFQTLETALAARERLQSTHAANIATADTPNYHADTRTFEDFFQTERSKHMDANMISGQNGDLNEHGLDGWNRTHGGEQQLDGNTVDMQKEMANMAENQLMHELTIRLLKGRLNGLAKAIKEGGR